jgi:hypothetical protein
MAMDYGAGRTWETAASQIAVGFLACVNMMGWSGTCLGTTLWKAQMLSLDPIARLKRITVETEQSDDVGTADSSLF